MGKVIYKYIFVKCKKYQIFSGLGYWSEQAFEAVHADFKLCWESMKVDIDHPEYLDKLLACIIRWNDRHI